MNLYWSLFIFLLFLCIINKSNMYKKYECCICFDHKYIYNYLSYCKHAEIICYECFFKIKENNDFYNTRNCPLCRNHLYVINVKRIKFTVLEIILITILRLQIIFIMNQKEFYDSGILIVFFLEFTIYDRYNIIQNKIIINISKIEHRKLILIIFKTITISLTI